MVQNVTMCFYRKYKALQIQLNGFQLSQIGLLDVMEAVEFCRRRDHRGPLASDRAFRRSEIMGIMGCL